MKYPITILVIILLSALGMTSCSDDLESLNDTEATLSGINFFELSETFVRYEDNKVYKGIGIFIDTTEYHTLINSQGAVIPFFQYGYNGIRTNWYPYNVSEISDNQPLYMNYWAGIHHFIFSWFTFENVNGSSNSLSRPTIRLADANLTLDADSKATIFLTDDVAEEGGLPAYKVVKVENQSEKNVNSGKVSVRFIHLGMDAGALHIRQLTQDNNEIDKDLVQDLKFGETSEYLQLDTTGVVSDGLLVFHVYISDNDEPLSAGVSGARLGSCFDVILHGFTQSHTRQIFTSIAEDSTLTYKTVEFPVSFTATVRQTY